MSNNIREVVDKAYREITSFGVFDKIAGNAPVDMSDILKDTQKKYSEHLIKNGKGCCLLFATYMLQVLHKNGIESSIVFTPEGDGIRGSLLYKDNGQYFVANPVEDIEFFTDNCILSDMRSTYYEYNSSIFKGKNTNHDDSRIPLQEFADRYGTVRYFTNYYSDTVDTFYDAYVRAFTDEYIIALPEVGKNNKKRV